MNKIAFTAHIHKLISEAIRKYYAKHSFELKVIPADMYLYNMMLERVCGITQTTSILLANWERDRTFDFSIEILLRPFLQDYLIFQYFSFKTHNAAAGSTDEIRIKNILENHAIEILSDGIAGTLNYISGLAPDHISAKEAEKMRRDFIKMFPIFFEKSGAIKKGYGANLLLSNIMSELKKHPNYKTLMKIYEDFYMVFSKKEHLTLIGHKQHFVNEQLKLETYWSATADMINHCIFLMQHMSVHLKKDIMLKTLSEDITSISKLFKTRI